MFIKSNSFSLLWWHPLIILFLILNPTVNLGLTDRKTTFNQVKINGDLAFTENLGRSPSSLEPSDALFSVDLHDLKIILNKEGLTYFFVASRKNQRLSATAFQHCYDRFDIELKGASIKKENIIKENSSSELYNFYYPHCPQGVMGVRKYQKLTVKNVYPGIDWVLQISEDEHLKYDFIIHPGADPNRIKLLYRTLNPIELKEGNIQVHSEGLDFSEQAPVSFLEENKIPVQSGFSILSQTKNEQKDFSFYETQIGFKLGNYDHSKTLVIDPLQLWWGTFYGGTHRNAQAKALCNDPQGNLYVLGTSESVNLPVLNYNSVSYFQGVLSGSTNPSPSSATFDDLYILKFTNSGQLLWATYLGGSRDDEAIDLKCDSAGNIFVLGESVSFNFPLKNPGNGTYSDTVNGLSLGTTDFYIGKFSGMGQYLWGTYYGGDDDDKPTCLTIDSHNNVYCSGYTGSANFPLLNPGGTFFDNLKTSGEAVIVKFSNEGKLELSTFFGGNKDDEILASSSDRFGNVFFCGHTNSSNLYTVNPGSGAFFTGTPLNSASSCGFILKLNGSDQGVWSTYIGNFGLGCNSIANDQNGNLFMSGSFGYNFPTVNPGNGAYFQATLTGCADHTISKFSPGGQMVWSTYYGTAINNESKVYAGKCNEIYLSTFIDDDFCTFPTVNPGNGAFFLSSRPGGFSNAFLSAFTESGVLRWATHHPASGAKSLLNVSCDKQNNIFYFTNLYLPKYGSPNSIQTFTSSCLVNPGNGAYFQTSTTTINPEVGFYSAIGKFTSPLFSNQFITAGCGANNSASIQTSSGWDSFTYTWSTGSQNDSISNVPNGIYTYTVRDAYFECSSTKTVYLGIPSLTLNIQSSGNEICLGQSAVLSVQGANTFSWSPGSGLNTNSGATVIASPQTTTQFTITGYNSPTCSTDSLLKIIVNPLPVLTVTQKDSVCSGINANFLVSGANTYSWIPTALFLNPFKDSVILNPTQSLVYKVIGKDKNNCIDSVSFNLNVVPTPTLSVTGPTLVCSENNFTLQLSGADSIQWFPKKNVSYIDSAGIFISNLNTNTTYTFISTNSKLCNDTNSYSLSVLPAPELSMSAPDSVCPDLNFDLLAIGNGTVSWSVPGSVDCNSCKSSRAKIFASSYILCYLRDNNSCVATDSSWINIKDCEPELIVPNIFTPNNDNANDFFKITGKNFINFSCDIVNRWGTPLFNSDAIDLSWNGRTPEGNECSDSVYMYVIRVTDVWNKEHIYKGTLQLIR